MDQPRLLQRTGDHGHRRPAHAQHFGEVFLGELERRVLGLVGAHQEPARAPLLHPMGRVTGDVLEEMGDEGLA